MIENEFKKMLTKAQYERIYEQYGWDKVIKQVNYYYDTPSLELSERHITCRVRKIGEALFLQIKFPNGAAGYSRHEIERNLEGNVPQKLSAELLESVVGEYLGVMPEAELLGELSTERCVKHFDGAELDLDKSSYFSKTDYELEVEFTDENIARSLVERLSRYANLPESSDVCAGKIRRFLAEYLAQKKQREA